MMFRTALLLFLPLTVDAYPSSSGNGKPCPFSRKQVRDELKAAAGRLLPANNADDDGCDKHAEQQVPKAPSVTLIQANTTYQQYVPGEAGAPWSTEVQLAVRAKLHRIFEEARSTVNEANIEMPNGGSEAWTGYPTEAKFLRLAFHDCLKYEDGTGGCDGCLEWNGMGVRFDRDNMGILNISTEETDGHNNGLQPTVQILEKIYTDATFPSMATALDVAPFDMGMSRADLWAFAAMVAGNCAP